ncbi:hypothetical protein LINPERPRIM_LOCUS41246 [Linum perenne]
MNHSWRGADF